MFSFFVLLKVKTAAKQSNDALQRLYGFLLPSFKNKLANVYLAKS